MNIAVSGALELDIQYLNGLSFDRFLSYVQREHPIVYDLIDPQWRDPKAYNALVAELNNASWEFELGVRGRGKSYNKAQQLHASNRARGMLQLLKLAMQTEGRVKGQPFLLLDALAGDGTIYRYSQNLKIDDLYLISSDLSAYMIDCCIDQKIPCLRQSASNSLLRDNTLDAVLIAYGSHHIPMVDRSVAVKEAWRTLRQGGRLVLHDFESGSPMEAWFSEVVHPYTHTGHDHPHFSKEELSDYFSAAQFREIEVISMPDPFETAGNTERDAIRNMLDFLHSMYGLDGLSLCHDEDYRALHSMVSRTLGTIELTTAISGDGYMARLDREAIVGTGLK